LTKYASNAMLASRISFMNELSLLCDKMGANIKQVRKGMSGDPRIGRHFLYAGAGYGGSCFPKDVCALEAMGRELGCDLPLISAIDRVNEKQKRKLPELISSYFEKKSGVRGKIIAIWGLAFKPETDDMRNAPSLTLINLLLDQGAFLKLYDPIAMENAKKVLPKSEQLDFCNSEYTAAIDTDAIALVTEWRQFRFVDFKAILSRMKGDAFFDGRNQYHPEEMVNYGFNYFGIGIKGEIQGDNHPHITAATFSD